MVRKSSKRIAKAIATKTSSVEAYYKKNMLGSNQFAPRFPTMDYSKANPKNPKIVDPYPTTLFR
jgi:hypothetical protein